MNDDRAKKLRKHIRKQQIKQIISGVLIVAVAVAGAKLLLSASAKSSLHTEKHDPVYQYVWDIPGRVAVPEVVETLPPEDKPVQPLSADILQYEGEPDSLAGVLHVTKAEASAHAYANTSASASFDAPNACDGSVATSWQVYTKDGVGQSVTFTLKKGQTIVGFCIWAGNWRDDRFPYDDVPTAVAMEFRSGGNVAEAVELRYEAEQTAYLCELSHPVTADSVTLTILESTGLYSEICLSEIVFLEEAETD